MKKLTALAVMAVFALAAGNVMALDFGTSWDYKDGQPYSLQRVFDDFTVGGPSSVNTEEDYISDDADSYWVQTATGTTAATMIIEIAGYAGSNTFGIYDSADSNNKIELFDGADSPGMANGGKTAFSILDNGDVYLNFGYVGNFSGSSFGFYLDSSAGANGGVFYSDTSLNDDGFDHMAAYQGVDDTVKIADSKSGTWNDNEYILAWEDLFYKGPGSTDSDYNDLVVMVESVEPLPEPGTLLLLGAGLLGLVGLRKRVK